MKVSSTWIVGLVFTLTALLSLLLTVQAQERTAYALQSRRGNEGISVVVNVNINPHRKKRSAAAFPIDDTTKKVVSSFKEAISSKEEREVSETYLEFAQKIKGIADQVDQVKTTEATELKQQLLTIVKDFTLKSEHPSVDLLQSSLSDISALNEKQPLKEEPAQQQEQPSTGGAVGPVSFEESGAKSLWLGQAISIASLGMNIVDGIGTYSDKISKVGKFLSGPVASKLDKWGLKGVAQTASKWGNSVDTFSQTKLKPIETKIAKKIAPVVKSKTFQAVRRTLNVVSGALSLKGGLKALGMVRNIKLPTSYKALKGTLTKATKFIKNRKQVMNSIRKTVSKTGKLLKNRKQLLNNVRKTASKVGKNWKKMNTIGKLKTANEFRKAYSGFKTGLSRPKKTSNNNNQGRRNGGSNKSGKSSQRSGSNGRSSGRSSGSRSSGSRSSSSRSSSGSRSKSSSSRSSGSRSSGSRSSSKGGRR